MLKHAFSNFATPYLIPHWMLASPRPIACITNDAALFNSRWPCHDLGGHSLRILAIDHEVLVWRFMLPSPVLLTPDRHLMSALWGRILFQLKQTRLRPSVSVHQHRHPQLDIPCPTSHHHSSPPPSYISSPYPPRHSQPIRIPRLPYYPC